MLIRLSVPPSAKHPGKVSHRPSQSLKVILSSVSRHTWAHALHDSSQCNKCGSNVTTVNCASVWSPLPKASFSVERGTRLACHDSIPNSFKNTYLYLFA